MLIILLLYFFRALGVENENILCDLKFFLANFQKNSPFNY